MLPIPISLHSFAVVLPCSLARKSDPSSLPLLSPQGLEPIHPSSNSTPSLVPFSRVIRSTSSSRSQPAYTPASNPKLNSEYPPRGGPTRGGNSSSGAALSVGGGLQSPRLVSVLQHTHPRNRSFLLSFSTIFKPPVVPLFSISLGKKTKHSLSLLPALSRLKQFPPFEGSSWLVSLPFPGVSLTLSSLLHSSTRWRRQRLFHLRRSSI